MLRERQSGNQHTEDQKVVNEFLTHLDRTGDDDILFIGATNVYDELDDAATSRFEREFHLDLPGQRTRKEIFTVQLRKRSHTLTDENLTKLAKVTDGFSAREIKNVVIDASRVAAFEREQAEIRYDDIRQALIESGFNE